MREASTSNAVSTKVSRIAEMAKLGPSFVFTNLAHNMDPEFLREAYRRTRKDGATGVDETSAEDYAANLEENLISLWTRAKDGSYYAPPVRRVHIPKGDGTKTRPIGIPTFEDKVLQRAVAMLLEPIYEHDFMPFSYGFRPRRSCHHALEALRNEIGYKGCWILELDIKGFFDNLKHKYLRDILDLRVRDKGLRKLIDKWLKAGVLEDGAITKPDDGSPQGGVISPLLANIYLHEVLDKWFEVEVKPRLKSRAGMVRYADDAVLVFQSEQDAKRVFEILPKRFGRYGLELHSEKTKLLHFKPSPKDNSQPRDWGSFDFLGFTHLWAKSSKGRWFVKRITAKDRLARSIRKVKIWCMENMHLPMGKQSETLRRKLTGHYNYYGLPGNYRRLASFMYQAILSWKTALNRRSQKAKVTWEYFSKVLERFPLPRPKIASYSLAANH